MRYLVSLILLFFCYQVAHAQTETTIRGVVLDDTNLPLDNASITSRSHGTVTDSTGHFTLNVTIGESITVSATGYQQVVRKVTKHEESFVIILNINQEKSGLEGVVVQGFTKKSKLVATAAISTVTADDIKDVPTANLADVLQGKIPGVNIQNTSGMPGSKGAIFQRGLSTINVTGDGNNAFLALAQPLIIIDGVPIDPNTDSEYGFAQAGAGVSPLALIPAEDIESIDILKDAAAISVYGSRGAYGVWIINTKRGKSARPQINYSANVFFNLVPQLRDVYGGRMERDIKVNQILNYNVRGSEYYGSALVNNIYLLSDSLNPYLNNSTNWQSLFFRNTVNQLHNLAVSGGTPAFNYKINMGYYDEKGIIANTGFKRYTVGLSTQYQSLNNKFRIQAAINGNNMISSKGSGVGLLQTGVATSGMASTLLPPPDVYTINNAALAAFRLKDDNKVANIMSNINLQLEILKGLRFITDNSININSNTYNTFYPSWLNTGSRYGLVTAGSNAQSQYNSYSNTSESFYNRNMLQYTTVVNKLHTFSPYIFTDVSIQKGRVNQFLLYGTPNEFYWGPIGFNIGKSRFGTPSVPLDRRTFGYGGSISYNYAQKYITDISYRLDGTSTNGPLVGYSHNPSIGLRWNYSKEKFLNRFKKWLDVATLRGSWGKSIVPQGDIFSVYGTYYPGSSYMGEPTTYLSYYSAPNARFLPNTSTQLNIGHELVMFRNRLTIIYDFFYRPVENQLRVVPMFREYGYTYIPTNDVSMVNYGNEFSIIGKPVQTEKLTWTINLNGSHVKNILTRLPGNKRQQLVDIGGQLGLPTLNRVGRSSFGNYLFDTRGVYSRMEDVPVDPFTGEQQKINGMYLVAGSPHFSDLDGNFVIDDRDRVVVGDPQPKLTGGLINTVIYGNWGLTVSSSYTFFRDVLNTPLARKFQYFYYPNNTSIEASQALPDVSKYDVWRAPGDVSLYPDIYNWELNSRIDAFRYNQTLFQEDGSYFKFNYVTLSYTFDKDFLRRYKVQSARVFVTGTNLLILSNYSGPNPETITDLGRDNPEAYPNYKKLSVGLNVTF